MEIYTILDCFANARNDGQRSLMTLSTLYTSIHNKATD